MSETLNLKPERSHNFTKRVRGLGRAAVDLLKISRPEKGDAATDERAPEKAALELNLPNNKATDLAYLRARYSDELEGMTESSVDEETFLHYRYAEDSLISSLEKARNNPEATDYAELLRQTFALSTYFNEDQAHSPEGTPLPLGMNDASLLAESLDMTRGLRNTGGSSELLQQGLSEAWNILFEKTKHLLAAPEGATYNPHTVLHEAFERSQRYDSPILEQYDVAFHIDTTLGRGITLIERDHLTDKAARQDVQANLEALDAKGYGPIDYETYLQRFDEDATRYHKEHTS